MPTTFFRALTKTPMGCLCSISAFFLIAIALVNIVILRGVWQTFQEVRKGGGYTDQSPDMLLGGGMMARIFRSSG
jgi:nickel/cobalt transporter (NiCoT) family protein